MARFVLKTGNKILKSGSKIFVVGDGKPPIVDINPGLFTGLTDNDAISLAMDYSGNSNNARQTDLTKQPTFKTNIFQGKPAILFNGSQVLELTAGIIPQTIMFIAGYISTVGRIPIFGGNTSAYWNNNGNPIFRTDSTGYFGGHPYNKAYINKINVLKENVVKTSSILKTSEKYG